MLQCNYEVFVNLRFDLLLNNILIKLVAMSRGSPSFSRYIANCIIGMFIKVCFIY